MQGRLRASHALLRQKEMSYIFAFKEGRGEERAALPAPSPLLPLPSVVPRAGSLLYLFPPPRPCWPPFFRWRPPFFPPSSTSSSAGRRCHTHSKEGRGEKWRPLRFSPFLLPYPALVPFFTFSLLRVVLGRLLPVAAVLRASLLLKGKGRGRAPSQGKHYPQLSIQPTIGASSQLHAHAYHRCKLSIRPYGMMAVLTVNVHNPTSASLKETAPKAPLRLWRL